MRLLALRAVTLLLGAVSALSHDQLYAAGPVFTNLVASAGDARITGTNPAGMTEFENAAWRASLIAAFSRGTWEATSSGLNQSSSTRSKGSGYVPSLSYVRPINGRWAVGGSLSAVGGLGDDGDEQSVSRYLSKNWSVGSYGLQSSAAYRLGNRWSFGFGVGVNFTQFSWEAAAFNGVGQPDGAVELEDGSIDLSYVLSAYWKPAPRTTVGFAWRSEYGPKITGRLAYANVDPDRQLDSDVRLDVMFPQNMMAGINHTLENGHWISVDLVWAESSEFDIQSAVVGTNGGLSKSSPELNDTWALSAGWGMPLDTRWSIGLGLLYLHEPVDDYSRSAVLRLDSMWGLGGSAQYEYENGRVIGANISWIDTGEAPVSTRDLPIVGVIEGAYSSHSAILLEVFLRW